MHVLLLRYVIFKISHFTRIDITKMARNSYKYSVMVLLHESWRVLLHESWKFLKKRKKKKKDLKSFGLFSNFHVCKGAIYGYLSITKKNPPKYGKDGN